MALGFQWRTCLSVCAFVPLLIHFPFITYALSFSYSKKWLNTCWTCSTIQKIPSLHNMSSVLNVARISVFHFYRIYCKCDISAYFPSKTSASYSEQKQKGLVTHCIHFQKHVSIYFYCYFIFVENNAHVISLRAGQSLVRKRQEKGIHLFTKMSRPAVVPRLFSWHHGVLSRR